MRVAHHIIALISMILIGIANVGALVAAESDWRVVKASGEIWIGNQSIQKITLNHSSKLETGDQIRTGKNGRVLLKRNKETIFIAPNSVIKIPDLRSDDGKTHIVQQSGTITLDVEKKNVKHFEVETPFLAAVVKGTRFTVSVSNSGSSVNVLRGKVEVSDHTTGQFVLITSGQTAKISPVGHTGIQLEGDGPRHKIKQGPKRKSGVKFVEADAPRIINAPKKNKLRAAETRKNDNSIKLAGQKKFSPKKVNAVAKGRRNVTKKLRAAKLKNIRRRSGKRTRLRIGRAIGHVRLNISKATKGLSRPKFAKGVKRSKSKKFATHWNGAWSNNGATIVQNVAADANNGNNGDNGNNGNNGNGNGNNGNNGNGNGNNGNNGNGNGNNGNNGNGNGNNGNNGNGNGNNGNNGNGNGNNGNGNGNGNNGNNGNGNGNNGNGNGNN